jgi:hypothetical protein
MARKKTVKNSDVVSKPATPRKGPATPTTVKKEPATAPAMRKSSSNGGGAANLTVQMTVTHDQIAAKAYEIWLRKGQPRGQDGENWYEAIAELSGTSAKPRH